MLHSRSKVEERKTRERREEREHENERAQRKQGEEKRKLSRERGLSHKIFVDVNTRSKQIEKFSIIIGKVDYLSREENE